MRRNIALAAAFAAALVTTAAMQLNHARVVEEQEGLIARAAIQPAQAESIALKAFPGTITESEIEEENGRLIYSFEIETANGAREVEVDAQTGALVEDVEEDDDDDDEKDDDRR